jgi:hypothetical protein
MRGSGICQMNRLCCLALQIHQLQYLLSSG